MEREGKRERRSQQEFLKICRVRAMSTFCNELCCVSLPAFPSFNNLVFCNFHQMSSETREGFESKVKSKPIDPPLKEECHVEPFLTALSCALGVCNVTCKSSQGTAPALREGTLQDDL